MEVGDMVTHDDWGYKVLWELLWYDIEDDLWLIENVKTGDQRYADEKDLNL